MKLLVINFLHFSVTSSPTSKYTPLHAVLKHPQFMFPLGVTRIKSQVKYYFEYIKFYCFWLGGARLKILN
jgi:hypothetical protein